MIIGLNFLNCIHGKVISVCDGKRTEFSNGEEMNTYYTQTVGKYAIQCIRVENRNIAVDMVEAGEEMEEGIRKWMKEEAEKNGAEPSFF